MSDEKNYQDGDIVWVKLGNYWWPAEVTGEHRQPEDLVRHLKRKPFCVVKFFQEDAYEYVKSAKQIYPFQCNKKEEFKKKGIALHAAKNKFMEKFPADVEIAENLTRKANSNSSLIINDRPDSIVKAILRQNPADGFDEYYDREYLAGETSAAIRRRDSVTKILNIKTDHTMKNSLDSSTSAVKKSDSGKKFSRFSTGSITEKRNTSLSGSADGDNTPVYHCSFCGLKSTRQNVMILHRRTHNVGATNILPTTPTFAPPKPIPKSTIMRKNMKINSPPPSVDVIEDEVSKQTISKRSATPFPRGEARYNSSTLDKSQSSTRSRRLRRAKDKSISPTRNQSVASSSSPSTSASSKSVETLNNVTHASDVAIQKSSKKKKKNISSSVAKRKLRSSSSNSNTVETASTETDAETSKTSILETEVSELSEKRQPDVLNENTEMTLPTPKCKTEEIRKRLLADWSDEEKDEEDQSNNEVCNKNSAIQSDSSLGTDMRVENEELSSKSEDFDVKIVKVSPPNFGFSSISNSNRVRNIPKKDRRDIVMKDFNNDHTCNTTTYSIPKTPPIVTIENSNSNSSDSVVVVEVLVPCISETIDLDQIIDSEDKIKVKDETFPDAIINDGDEMQEIESSSAINAEVSKSNADEETPKLSCFDFQDEENDTDMLTSIANFKKKYLSPEKVQLINIDNEEAKSSSINSKQQDLQKKDQQLSVEINSLLNQATPSVRDIAPIVGQTSSTLDKEEESVRGLPIKERGKRIFKSRNRSRTDDLSLDRNIFNTNAQSDNDKNSVTNNEKNITSEYNKDDIVHIDADSLIDSTTNHEHDKSSDLIKKIVKSSGNEKMSAEQEKLNDIEVRTDQASNKKLDINKSDELRTLQIENECNDLTKEQSKVTETEHMAECVNEESSSYISSEAEAEFGSPVSIQGDDRALQIITESPEENKIKLTEWTDSRSSQSQADSVKIENEIDKEKGENASLCLANSSREKTTDGVYNEKNSKVVTNENNVDEKNHIKNSAIFIRSVENVINAENLKKDITASDPVPVNITNEEMTPTEKKMNSDMSQEVPKVIDSPQKAQFESDSTSSVSGSPNKLNRKRRSFIKITPRRNPNDITMQMDPTLNKGLSPVVPRKQLLSVPLEMIEQEESNKESIVILCADLSISGTTETSKSSLNVSKGSAEEDAEEKNISSNSSASDENNTGNREFAGENSTANRIQQKCVTVKERMNVTHNTDKLEEVNVQGNSKESDLIHTNIRQQSEEMHSTTVSIDVKSLKNPSNIGTDNGKSPLTYYTSPKPEITSTVIEKVQITVDIKNPLSSQIANILANKCQQQAKDIISCEITSKKRVQTDSNALPMKRKKTIEGTPIIERPSFGETENILQEQTNDINIRKENIAEVHTINQPVEQDDNQKLNAKQLSTVILDDAVVSTNSVQSVVVSPQSKQPQRKDSSKGLKRSASTELFSKEEELQSIQKKLTDNKKQIGTDSRGNKVIIIKSSQPSELVVQAAPIQTQIVTNDVKVRSSACDVTVSSTSLTSLATSIMTSPTNLITSPSKPKTPAAAVTGGRKQAGNTIALPSPNSVKQQQQKLGDELAQARNVPADEVILELSPPLKNKNENRTIANVGQSYKSAQSLSKEIHEQEFSKDADIVYQSVESIPNQNSSEIECVDKEVILQIQQQQLYQPKACSNIPHHLHNRKPRKQPQQHRLPQKKSSLSVVHANEMNIIAPIQQQSHASDLEDIHPSTPMNQSVSASVSTSTPGSASAPQVAIKQTINSNSLNEDKLTQMQAELDGTAKILAVPTHPIRGYNETFLLCTLVNNNYKPIDNVPLYLDHDLNQLVPVPLEALDGEPSLVVNHPPPDDGTVQLPTSSSEQHCNSQLMKSNNIKSIQSDSPTQIVSLPTTVDNGAPSSLTPSVDGHLLAESIVEADNQVAVFIPNDNVADNAIILNIEGQQIILDSATFAHLLANPDANTQLITDDGTEFVLTRDVLAALEAQHEAQTVTGLSEEQLQQQFDLVAANAAQLPSEPGSSDILAVALAGTELYSSDMLQIETSQGLQDLIGSDGNIVFQSSALAQAHLTPPITALTSETNALLNQTPIMSTLEKPSMGKLKPGELISNVDTNSAAVLLGTSVASNLPVVRPNLEDSLAVIGVTTQPSTVPASLELPITVTNPAIAPKVTLAGSPQNIITYQPQRPVLPGQETRIFNDPGS